MNRACIDNPLCPDFKIMVLQFGRDIEKDWYALGVQRPPMGTEAFVTMDGDEMRIGIRPIKAAGDAKDKPKDDLGSKSLEELQTLCAMKGITYTPEMKAKELLAMLRGKK